MSISEIIGDRNTSTVTFKNGSLEPNVVLSLNTKIVVTCTNNDETSESKQYISEKVSQSAEIKNIRRSNSINNINKEDHDAQCHTIRRSSSCSSFHKEQSFAIPDGLVMDPLAPTALAVSTEFMDRIGSGLTLLRQHGKKVQKYVWKNRKFDILKKSWKSIVNVVLIEAKDLPEEPTGNVYCKFKLGNENHKSKQVSNKSKPMWCERFNLHIYEENCLEVTVWQKGKQKNFLGKCVIDLSRLDKEKTHDVWQDLECGFGSLHMLVTVSGSARSMAVDNVPTTTGAHVPPDTNDFTWYRLNKDWSEVGQLTVTVHGARGLSALGISGKADAYCVLELDNSRVQTHTVPGSTDPTWDKNYTFAVHDVTSTIDITVYDESFIHENLGRISLPLLRIENDEKRWYALKDRTKKTHAKGKCPRILLQMSLVWNPIKASLRVLTPKESKYSDYKKPNKFNIPLIYNNLKFIKDIFAAVILGNEHFKYLFEWDKQELSVAALICWLMFWFFFQMWMTPLLAIVPFAYYWISSHRNSANTLVPITHSDEESDEDELEAKDDKTLKTRIYELQDLTFTIKNGIDFICSLVERLKNLANFTVPYLSCLVISAMLFLTVALYLLPINYLFMGFGIYKFGRKFLNPDRVPNNDILDFLSRVPDDEILKQWRELKVTEPSLSRNHSNKRL